MADGDGSAQEKKLTYDLAWILKRSVITLTIWNDVAFCTDCLSRDSDPLRKFGLREHVVSFQISARHGLLPSPALLRIQITVGGNDFFNFQLVSGTNKRR
jgi:hypothetical protein